jgi:hypothetical protein
MQETNTWRRSITMLIRDRAAADKVRIFKILTTYQLADMMTKNLGKQSMDRLKSAAMGHRGAIMIACKQIRITIESKVIKILIKEVR